MARKQNAHETRADDSDQDAEVLSALRLAAQQLWIAGINTLLKTQKEGSKIVDAFKEESEQKNRARPEGLAGNVGRAAAQATRGASATMDRLEEVFEAGVKRTLRRMGVPTAEQMQEVIARLDALESGSARPAHKASAARAAPPTPRTKAPAEAAKTTKTTSARARPKTAAKAKSTATRAASSARSAATGSKPAA